MGLALSWLGVNGKSVDAILSDLRLRSTGVRGVDGEAPVAGAMSETGWYLIVANDAEHRLISAPVVERLSIDCEVVTCTVEERVMFSEATGWRNGRRLWSATHRGEDGPTGIDAEGSLPAEYQGIRDALVAKQEAEGGGARRYVREYGQIVGRAPIGAVARWGFARGVAFFEVPRRSSRNLLTTPG
jgi:hypothetical protein